jgi:hypothetical protein
MFHEFESRQREEKDMATIRSTDTAPRFVKGILPDNLRLAAVATAGQPTARAVRIPRFVEGILPDNLRLAAVATARQTTARTVKVPRFVEGILPDNLRLA